MRGLRSSVRIEDKASGGARGVSGSFRSFAAAENHTDFEDTRLTFDGKLKKIVLDLSLDKAMLEDVIRRKL